MKDAAGSNCETGAGAGCSARWKFRLGWLLMLIAVGCLFAAAGHWRRFPGDLELSRAIQANTGESTAWATTATNLVRAPAVYWILGVVSVAAWAIQGWRAAVMVPAGYCLFFWSETWLKELAERPRPTRDLVEIVGASGGYSFPSGFGLITGAMFLFLILLAWNRYRGPARWIAVVPCLVLLLVGGAARVRLGAHWPSDLLGAWLVAGLWSLLAAQWAGSCGCGVRPQRPKETAELQNGL